MPKNILMSVVVTLALAGMAGSADAALMISTAPTSNVSCAAGVCTATAADAVLNDKDLKKLLDAADVKVVSGSLAQDIVFNAKFKWTKPTRLTLDAYRSIVFKLAVTAEGTGGVTLITNDGGTGGDYSFSDKGKLTFWDTSSSLIINGASFTLVADIHALASEIAANSSGAYALSNGYDASADGIYAHAPIPTTFSGTLQGLGHSVVNLSIMNTGDAGIGLFAAVNGAWLRDLHIVNATIVANNVAKAGTLVGDAVSVVIIHCASTGTISGSGGDVGGLAGDFVNLQSEQTTSDIQADVDISGTFQIAGGLIGKEINFNTLIELARASGAVKVASAQYAGGLVGNIDGEIERGYATGDVVAGPGSRAGGLIGGGFAGISDAFATGDVTGGRNSKIGGLVGEFGGFFVEAYATGRLHGMSVKMAGGLIGKFDPGNGNITWAYTIADLRRVTGELVGGVIGQDRRSSGTLTDVYWDLNVSGIDDPSRGAGSPANDPGITGLTDAQLKSGLPNGFSSDFWAENPDINNGYPYLVYMPPPQ